VRIAAECCFPALVANRGVRRIRFVNSQRVEPRHFQIPVAGLSISPTVGVDIGLPHKSREFTFPACQ
jgi:hypothetical protein